MLVPLLVLVGMLASLLVIPLGLPGLWMITALTLVLTLLGHLSWTFGYLAVAAALVAEVGEFMLLKRIGARYGGSRKAFWGAVIGGMAGLFVGVPIPLVGPVIVAFAGTFAGALLVTWWETRSLERSTRVGWGVVLGRTAAVVLKAGAGLMLIAAVAVALVFG